MILLFGGEKGGTGKTTMALNLAIWRIAQGRDVLLIDADVQGTSSKWLSIRSQEAVEPAVTCVALYGNTLAEQVRKLAPRYQDVIIDSGGADAPELRSAMLVADALVTPISPSQFDLFTMGKMNELVYQSRTYNPGMRAEILVNLAPATTDEAGEMREMCAELTNYRLLATTIGVRKAYRTMAKTGRALHEMKPCDKKAAAEIEQLAAEVWQ